MIEKIFDANDKALEEHVLLGYLYTDHRGRILFQSTRLGCQWTGKVEGDPVQAYIDFSRWLAACPDCGGLEYVTPTDPIFFCHSCGNVKNNRSARPVTYPADAERQAIEAALLERGVTPGLAVSPIEQVRSSKPDIPGLPRNWQPGQTAKDLRAQAKKLTADYQATQPGKGSTL